MGMYDTDKTFLPDITAFIYGVRLEDSIDNSSGLKALV
jgi:hypothetical protein